MIEEMGRWRSGIAGLFLAAALVRSYSAQAWTYEVLHDFCAEQNCADGTTPIDLVVRKSGKISGVTFEGGTRTYGTAFALTPPQTGTKWKYKVSFDFCACSDGGSPDPGVMQDRHANLYAITEFGFAQIYKLSPRGALNVLYTFDVGSAASLTYTGVSAGAPYDGRSPLYGVSNGASNDGSVFALTPQHGGQTWAFSTIYSFCADQTCSDGQQPLWMVADTAGNLFGATLAGGEANQGVLFELRPAGAGFKETVLHSFCDDPPACADGKYPSGIAIDAKGNLFGAMSGGGANDFGTVYELARHRKRSTFSVLHSFCSAEGCTDGADPHYGLALDSNGNVFGTAAGGGANRQGSLFEISRKKFRKLYDFCALENCADGGFPARLAIDPLGNVFGVTQFGGNDSYGGTLFELTP